MSTIRLKRLLLNATRLRRRQLLRPLRHRIRDKALWSFAPQPLARGAALGVFFGILVPLGHTVLVVICAIALRANIIVGAAATLISTPFTLPLIYYWAHAIGAFVLGRAGVETPTAAAVIEAEAAIERTFQITYWFSALREWATSVAPPLALGLVVLATGAALAVYALIYAISGLWRRATGADAAHETH